MNPIILPVAEVKPALTGLSKVTHSRAANPVLQCVKLERTAEGWITLTTTDTRHFITLRLEQPAKGNPVSMLLPFDALANLIKNSNRGDCLEVAPAQEGKSLLITCNKAALASSTPINSPPVAEFPRTPKIEGNPVPLSPSVRQSIHEAMACTSEAPTRMILHGAFIDVQDPKGHYVVATDGRHLYSSNSFTLPLKNSVLIPRHKFLAWREFNNDGEWQIKCSDPTWVQLSSRRWRFIAHQIEGVYPKWRAVLPNPADQKTTLTIDPECVAGLMQVINQLAGEGETSPTVGLQWKDQKLHLLDKPGTSGPWNPSLIPLVRGKGSTVTIFLDRTFLQKALSLGLNTISIIDEMSPLRFSREGKTLIVMPVRVNAEVFRHPRPQTFRSKEERSTQINTPMTSSPPPTPPNEQPLTMDTVIETVHELRESFINGINKLRDLGAQLKHLQREQRTSSRELNSVRSTLRSLQSLKL